jgi:hypothetical protein
MIRAILDLLLILAFLAVAHVAYAMRETGPLAWLVVGVVLLLLNR